MDSEPDPLTQPESAPFGAAEQCSACGAWTADLYRIDPVTSCRTSARYCPPCFEALHRRHVREYVHNTDPAVRGAWRRQRHVPRAA